MFKKTITALALAGCLVFLSAPAFSQQTTQSVTPQEDLLAQQQLFFATLDAQQNMVTLFGPAVNQLLIRQVLLQNFLSWFVGF